jgi:phage baseplate assembly protein W
MAFVRQDFAYPVRVDVAAASQQTAQTNYPAHVDQMVRQLLLTAPGERVNLPQFGCGLRSLVFAANTDALAATVKLRVIQGLNQWLAGVVNVVSVDTAGGPGDAAAEPGTLEVTVTYTLVETQTNQAVTVTIV